MLTQDCRGNVQLRQVGIHLSCDADFSVRIAICVTEDEVETPWFDTLDHVFARSPVQLLSVASCAQESLEYVCVYVEDGWIVFEADSNRSRARLTIMRVSVAPTVEGNILVV